MSEVELTDLAKVFPGNVTAVDGVNLHVPEGQVVTLVGPSGCGKTTLLRLIAGLDRPTRGEIRLGGRLANGLSPHERDLALMMQQAALYPHLNVHDNLAAPLRWRKLPTPKIATRVQNAAESVGIAELLKRQPHELSSGQQQRVSLARALARRPQCLLLDEPLAHLDAPLAAEIRWKMQELQRRWPVTTIHVTHDQHEALRLGDRVAVMHAGRILQCGPAREIYDRPANRQVARFIGSPTMNFFEGRLVAAHDGIAFETAAFRISLPIELDSTLQLTLVSAIVCGIRPEDIRLATAASSQAQPQRGQLQLDAELVHVSNLGDRNEAQLLIASGQTLIATWPRADCSIGSTIRLQIEPKSLHFFEPGTLGKNLLRDAKIEAASTS